VAALAVRTGAVKEAQNHKQQTIRATKRFAQQNADIARHHFIIQHTCAMR
jgi:hypothetical protein